MQTVVRRSNSIPLNKLVRAYELYMTTDMDLKQISRALLLKYTTLRSAIKRAELKGLVGEYIPQTSTKVVLNCIQTYGAMTAREVADHTGLSAKVCSEQLRRAVNCGAAKAKKKRSYSIYYPLSEREAS
ncbi:winged helix-turn-helix domain-containing protein [Agarilytica rhodophyticola]|uniref:winged helix-turn-helix domain-containing protein n=1 Tax=Agarilytica rhodophyticola TaxID=1737490 RepID=UPI001315933A|nr:winged helix-turn-helix domain-containing protein [Agarilytica rhodophyticola]